MFFSDRWRCLFSLGVSKVDGKVNQKLQLVEPGVVGTWSSTLPPIGLAGQAATHFSQPPTWAHKQCAHSSVVCLHSFPYDVVRPATPECTSARAYEGKKKKTGMSRSRCRNYCFQLLPSLPEYFSASEWLSRVPLIRVTQIRVNKWRLASLSINISDSRWWRCLREILRSLLNFGVPWKRNGTVMRIMRRKWMC